MIEGGLNFVYAAYAVTVLTLVALALGICWRALHWARQVRQLDRKP